MYITILVKQIYWYIISQVSGERLQDHWSSGFSHLQLEQEIEDLSLTEQSNSSSESVSPTAHSAPVTPSCNPGDVDIDYSNGQQGGFFEGLLGCLRPVWTIIGKAAAAELKQQGINKC